MLKSYFIVILYFFATISFAQDLQRVRKTVAELAAADMFGRGYTFGGDRKAANYIAQKFEDLGLNSYKHKRKTPYFQDFTLDINTFPKNPILQIGTTKLEAGKDFIVQSNSKSGHGNCMLFEIDTLIFSANEQAIDMFLNTDLNHKVLVYPSRFESALYKLPIVLGHWFSATAFIKTSPKLTMSLAMQADSPPTFEVRQNLMDSILTKNRQNSIKIQFDLTNKVIKNYDTQNVIAYQKGTTKPDSIVVFSAHYDHLGTLGESTIFYGANDNASGISMLLEFANYYKQNPPPFTVVFMAFGAEEVGLLGSKYFVENPLFELSQIKLLINLDLVGTGNEGLGVVNSTVFPELYAKFAKINTQNNYFPKIIKRGKAANSDHYFFTESGVPSFFIYAMGGIQAYHDVNDRAETLPLTKYSELFKLILEWVEKL
jgi:aminopeptidase YwaD